MTNEAVSLRQFHDEMVTHHEKDETAPSEARFASIQPHVVRMRQAVTEQMGEGMHVIGGEQSAFARMKHVGKLFGMKALAALDDRIISINLRANLDYAASQGDIHTMDIPFAGSQTGETSLNSLSGKKRKEYQNTAIDGVPLDDEYFVQQMQEFHRKTMDMAYAGRYMPENGDTAVPVMNEQVVRDFFGCYGFEVTDSGLVRAQALPANLAGSEQTATSPGKMEQMQIVTPVSLADGHENWYIYMQREMGLEMAHTLSEGQIDRMLLQNGGMEILQETWKGIRQMMRESGYSPVVGSLVDEDRDGDTFFNANRGGVRYATRFVDGDDSLIEYVNPDNTDERGTVPVQEMLYSDDWDISLQAVSRVVLYSLSGMAGHVTGGGSAYNTDASMYMTMLGMDYFPTWHFAKRNASGQSQTPFSHAPIGHKQLRNTPPDVAGKMKGAAHSMLDKGARGQYALFDVAMSVDPASAHKVMEEMIAAFVSGEIDIDSDTQVQLRNRAGYRVDDFPTN